MALIPTNGGAQQNHPSVISPDSKPSNSGSNGSASAVKVTAHQPSPNYTAVDFAAFGGTFIELIRPLGSSSNALKFLVWDGKGSSMVDHFDHDARRLIPPVLDAKSYRNLNLRLPDRIAEETWSAREIFDSLCVILQKVVDLPTALAHIAVAFALSTWLIDKLPAAPYLCITGPPCSGKTTLLRWLHCFCRRAVHIAGPIGPAIYSLPALVRPTLLLDEGCFSTGRKAQPLQCWLRAGNIPGIPVHIGGELVDSYGAKVLCSREPVADSALASRALHIAMAPSKRTMMLTEQRSLELIASHLQPLLLKFRLLHYEQFDPQIIKVSSSNPRFQELQLALMSPFCREQETVPEIREALSEQYQDAQAERHGEPECLVVRALFAHCHRLPKILVGQLARSINNTLKELGEEGLKPRAVGEILKSLGFKTRVMGSLGRGIEFTKKHRERIHDLFQLYDLRNLEDNRCGLCEERFGKPEAQPKT